MLVDVAAAGVNFPDVLQTKGLYQHRPELPYTLGAELAGTVREAPDGSPLAPGDRVAAFTSTGAFAEVAAVDAEHVLPLPDNVSFEAGAGLPMNYLTAHFALLRAGPPAGGPGGARPRRGRRGRHGVRPAGRGARRHRDRRRVQRRQGRGGPRGRGGARRARRGLPRRRQGAGRGRPRRGPGRRRPLHRLPALPPAARAAAGDRLHRGRDPDGQGQPVAARTTSTSSASAGAPTPSAGPASPRGSGTSWCRTSGRARSTRRSGPASRWRRRRRR